MACWHRGVGLREPDPEDGVAFPLLETDAVATGCLGLEFYDKPVLADKRSDASLQSRAAAAVEDGKYRKSASSATAEPAASFQGLRRVDLTDVAGGRALATSALERSTLRRIEFTLS